eukprot:COSAG01_NODE_7930_length_2987_cov_100.025277_4_plen_82_part_00
MTAVVVRAAAVHRCVSAEAKIDDEAIRLREKKGFGVVEVRGTQLPAAEVTAELQRAVGLKVPATAALERRGETCWHGVWGE